MIHCKRTGDFKMEVNFMKRTLVSYFIALIASIVCFLMGMNFRTLILRQYLIFLAGEIPWGLGLLNISTIVILTIICVICFFYTHYYFEEKCNFTARAYAKASLKFVLPVIVLYLLSEILIRFTLYS